MLKHRGGHLRMVYRTKNNFNKYRMIRHSEAPKAIDIHFVQNDIDPTGMGEPTFPPTFGALANALYKATGKRLYDQPFNKDLEVLPSKM